MTATIPTPSFPLPVIAQGKHTRNKRSVAARTCDNCPSEIKSACQTLCPDMERHLDANGGTISHNSPVAGQLKWDSVADMTDPAAAAGAAADGGGPSLMLKYAVDSVRKERLTETSTPESLLLDTEAARRAETLILQHVAAFCQNAVRENSRERSVVESIVVLHYLEGYTINRTAEILGERFEEYAGFRENERTFRSDRKQALAAPKVEREPKGRFKVARTLKKFQEYIRSTHLSAAIHTCMETGTVTPLKKFAAEA